jgi:hypothetical protein
MDGGQLEWTGQDRRLAGRLICNRTSALDGDSPVQVCDITKKHKFCLLLSVTGECTHLAGEETPAL